MPTSQPENPRAQARQQAAPASADPRGDGRISLPLPLRIALGVVLLEAVVYVVIGILEWAATDWDKPVVALTTGFFFVAFGAFLGFCVWRLALGEVWARAPIVMAQILQLPVALSFWDGSGWTAVVAIVLAVVSVVTLVGVFHPASLRALADDE